MNKEVSEFIHLLRKIPGVSVKTRGRHPKIYLDGALVSTLPTSPSDHRWKLNSISELRQKGIDVRSFKEEKRDANGQAPPPLPTPMKEATVPDALATKTASENAHKMANKIAKGVEALYELTPRKGRVVGHGVAPHLAEVLIAYSQDVGVPIPHRDYKQHYDVNDMRQMARLASMRVGNLAAEARGAKTGGSVSGELTKKTVEIIVYANKAWEWFEKRGYEMPSFGPPETDEVPSTVPEEWAEAQKVPEVTTNGDVGRDEIDTLFEAIALMGQNGNTYEAARIGKKLYEALGR